MDFGNTRSSIRKGKTYGDTLKNGASGEPVFGRPSKPREDEPSLSELMQWQPHAVEKADFKKMKKDLLPFEDPQFEFYRSKIQKAENPWVSEARDNYRNFKDPERDIKTRHYNPLSGEYSAPFPLNGGGRVDMQHHSMMARRIEYPTAAGNEFAASMPMRTQPLMAQPPQYQQYQQQSPYQLQVQQQQPAHMNSMQSMLNPSQVQYPGDILHMQQQTQHADQKGTAQHFQLPEADQEEFADYEEEGEEVDPEQAALDHQHMKDFLRTARWKPDSYTQKVLARPAFMNYGYKNVKPTVGGFCYGQYLHSHNVNPQRGMQPEYRQVYKNAQTFGDRVPPHTAPQIPRPKPPTVNEEKKAEDEMKRTPLEAEKLKEDKKEKKKEQKSANASVRPASAGKAPNGIVVGLPGSVGKLQQQSPIQQQSQNQQQQPRPQSNYQIQPSQALVSPKIAVAPVELDQNRAQMTAGEKERLMAKVGKDGGYSGTSNNYHLSPQDMTKTVKMSNRGGAGAPHVGFVDQLSETKKVAQRKDSGYESNYGGASSIGKYPGYDDFLEVGSGF